MSCLFQSLAFFLHDVDEKEIRHKICDYLDTNPHLMDDLSLNDILVSDNIDKDEYIQCMRNHHTWGGAIEIKAFCEIFKLAVDVRIRQTDKNLLFIPSDHPFPSKIRIEWQGTHYIPLPY